MSTIDDFWPTPPDRAERSPLELAAGFLADHLVVDLLQRGAEPLLTISVLRYGDRIEVVPTLHVEESDEALRPATYAALNACRVVIDSIDGEGEAAKALFTMVCDSGPICSACEKYPCVCAVDIVGDDDAF